MSKIEICVKQVDGGEFVAYVERVVIRPKILAWYFRNFTRLSVMVYVIPPTSVDQLKAREK